MRLIRDGRGTSTIEFAIALTPFLGLIFMIFQVTFMLFVDSALDAALQKTARDVRTGLASKQAWNLATFKSKLCANMADSFDCATRLKVMTTVMGDFSTVAYAAPVKGGVLTVTESFSPGAKNDYVLIQAFMSFGTVLPFTHMGSNVLNDGSFAISAISLFRIEPFE